VRCFRKALAGLLATARTRLEDALAVVAKERAQGLAEVTMQQAELRCEIDAMQTQQEQHEGRVELNIGGHRFQTSVQTLRRVPHTFFDAYFSGRYAQDVCLDGRIFVDRDGKHFGYVLEYMRDGVVSVADAGVQPSVSLLRALKREFGYCRDAAEQPSKPAQLETAYVMGGVDVIDNYNTLSSMERYDAASGQWSAVAAMSTAHQIFGACVIANKIYVTGGMDSDDVILSSVEKYSPLSDTWSAVTPMPEVVSMHLAVVVGLDMYVLGYGAAEGILQFASMQGFWSVGAPAPQNIYDIAVVAVGTDIYVFGGLDFEGAKQDSVLKYDTVADAWSMLAPMPYASSEYSACIHNGLVHIVGAGEDGHEVLRFDPASAEWSTLAPTLNERSGCKLFLLGGILYVPGMGVTCSGVERYDVAADTWTTAAVMLEGRSCCEAVTIGFAGPAEEQGLFDSLIDKASRRQP
jgi:hypothetical protein